MDHPVATPPRSHAALVSAGLWCVFPLAIALAHGLLLWSGDLSTIFGIPLTVIGVVVFAQAILAALRPGAPVAWRVAPLLLCITTLLVVIFVPFSRLGTDWEFAAHRAEREAAAHRIAVQWRDAELPATAPLGNPPPLLSRDYNAVDVARCGAATCVLFFTWPSTDFEAAEGFLYVPAGGDPARFGSHGRYVVVRPLGGRWWYVRAA
jgi:hypothetical protein